MMVDITAEHFNFLADQYERETAHLSFTETRNPAYQEIVKMGERVVPFLMRRIVCGHLNMGWFAAMKTITGVDPVRKKDRGNVQAIAKRWIRWYATGRPIRRMSEGEITEFIATLRGTSELPDSDVSWTD